MILFAVAAPVVAEQCLTPKCIHFLPKNVLFRKNYRFKIRVKTKSLFQIMIWKTPNCFKSNQSNQITVIWFEKSDLIWNDLIWSQIWPGIFMWFSKSCGFYVVFDLWFLCGFRKFSRLIWFDFALNQITDLIWFDSKFGPQIFLG
jgi:hypothetical protein